MANAGYSGTPLAKKLGIKAGHVVVLLDAPEGIDDWLAPLPEGVQLATEVGTDPDVIVAFFTARSTFDAALPALGAAIHPAASLWIAWPKRASKVQTDMTEDVVREVALPTGLVDNKVCAVSDVWSGLRLVWRKELRTPR